MAMMDVEESLLSDKVTKIHALITTRTYEFSDERIHIPEREVRTKYSGQDEQFEKMFGLKIFANGWPSTNKGFVTVTFYPKYADLPIIGFCLISVIDAYENQRFSQTYTINDMKNKEDKYIKYISREKLLSESDEFLPKDVLTLQIDATFVFNENGINEVLMKSKKLTEIDEELVRARLQIMKYLICVKEPSSGREINKLRLDSPLAKCLAEESPYFQDILNTPMLEQSTKTMVIANKEYMTFMNIGQIVMKNRKLEFFTVKEIFDMCILADKYVIPYVTELCTGFLKLCLCRYSVDDYLEIANEYKIEGLREILVKVINQVSMTNLKEETSDVSIGVYLKQPIRKCIWFYSKISRVLNFSILDEESMNWYEAMKVMYDKPVKCEPNSQ